MLPIRTILHPTDFSECSRHACEFAASLARDYHARLVLLHVLEPPIRSPEIAAFAVGEGSILREHAEENLVRLATEYKDLHCEHRIADGFAATGIIHVAEETRPDLIVLGTHGRTGLVRLLMGSVADEVIRRAPCPVVALKPTDVPTVDYEDWIAAAMATAERREKKLDKSLGVEAVSRTANASYAATVEHTVRTTNRWLRDIRRHLPDKHAPQAFRLVRAVLHILRDHLPVDHVASMGAQLPLFLRGILYEGWDPKRKSERHSIDFLEQIKMQLAPDVIPHPEQVIHGVLAGLGKHLSAGEVRKLKRALPHQLREMWEPRVRESTQSLASGEFV
jgi:nucleotide-binding universal stress UspA family protein/uncharacterized protein (DUF2267 family)